MPRSAPVLTALPAGSPLLSRPGRRREAHHDPAARRGVTPRRSSAQPAAERDFQASSSHSAARSSPSSCASHVAIRAVSCSSSARRCSTRARCWSVSCWSAIVATRAFESGEILADRADRAPDGVLVEHDLLGCPDAVVIAVAQVVRRPPRLIPLVRRQVSGHWVALAIPAAHQLDHHGVHMAIVGVGRASRNPARSSNQRPKVVTAQVAGVRVSGGRADFLRPVTVHITPARHAVTAPWNKPDTQPSPSPQYQISHRRDPRNPENLSSSSPQPDKLPSPSPLPGQTSS